MQTSKNTAHKNGSARHNTMLPAALHTFSTTEDCHAAVSSVLTIANILGDMQRLIGESLHVSACSGHVAAQKHCPDDKLLDCCGKCTERLWIVLYRELQSPPYSSQT